MLRPTQSCTSTHLVCTHTLSDLLPVDVCVFVDVLGDTREATFKEFCECPWLPQSTRLTWVFFWDEKNREEGWNRQSQQIKSSCAALSDNTELEGARLIMQKNHQLLFYCPECVFMLLLNLPRIVSGCNSPKGSMVCLCCRTQLSECIRRSPLMVATASGSYSSLYTQRPLILQRTVLHANNRWISLWWRVFLI